jgi:hypothetical protein
MAAGRNGEAVSARGTRLPPNFTDGAPTGVLSV